MRIFLCIVLQFITTLDYRWANEIEDTTSMKNSLVQIPLILTPFRYSEGWTVHFRSYSHVPRYPYAPPHGSPNLLPHIVQHPHVSKTSWASGQDSCTSVTFSHLPVSHPSHPRSGAVFTSSGSCSTRYTTARYLKTIFILWTLRKNQCRNGLYKTVRKGFFAREFICVRS